MSNRFYGVSKLAATDALSMFAPFPPQSSVFLEEQYDRLPSYMTQKMMPCANLRILHKHAQNTAGAMKTQ